MPHDRFQYNQEQICSLDSYRQHLGLTDYRFARTIGISNALWLKMKKGELGLSDKTKIKFLNAFPDAESIFPSQPSTSIGSVIKHRRHHLGLTQNELSRLSGVSPWLISHVESGNYWCKAKSVNIWKLAKVLGLKKSSLRKLARD